MIERTLRSEQLAKKKDDFMTGVLRERHRGESTSKIARRLRRVRPYLFDLPGAFGDGIVALIKDVEWAQEDAVSEGINDVAFAGALASGYCSHLEEDEGAPYPNEDDMARWLYEPAPRIDVLLALCEQLDISPPSYLLYALMHQPVTTIDESKGQAA